MRMDQVFEIVDHAFWGTFYDNLYKKVYCLVDEKRLHVSEKQIRNILQLMEDMSICPFHMEMYAKFHAGEYLEIKSYIKLACGVSSKAAEELFLEIMQLGVLAYVDTRDTIKCVLFGDHSSYTAKCIWHHLEQSGKDPLDFISQRKDASLRKKINGLRKEDTFYLLVKFSMEDFGNRRKKFQLHPNDVALMFANDSFSSDTDITEVVSYALRFDPTGMITYDSLYPKIYSRLVDQFLESRYYYKKDIQFYDLETEDEQLQRLHDTYQKLPFLFQTMKDRMKDTTVSQLRYQRRDENE